MVIKHISIKNFRSIQSCDLDLNELSVFVGQNDVGKSNILKALNLFFNDETDFGKPFSFSDDYSKYAIKKKKKAPEIIIELTIAPPKHYKESKDIKWKRVWRQTGTTFFDEEIINVDRSKFPKRSKINFWLKNIRFEYIPAVRDTHYFTNLLGKLHDTLAETIEHELRGAGEDFIKAIRENTKEMVSGLNQRLGLSSQIRLPTSLQSLFKVLDFETIDGLHTISLAQRGDGIKTRHIPVILKFIADQLNVTRAKGSPSITLLWGYEEPENNLELSVAFKLGKDFLDYSTEIQILLTTHSPGFYNLRSSEGEVSVYNVTKQLGMPAYIENITNTNKLDEDLGLMPVVAPYIEKKLIEINNLKTELRDHKNELSKLNKNVIFVEGDDEVRIFERIITLRKKITKITVKREAFGCTGVKQQLMAWSWVSGFSDLKALGVFDLDDSGKNEKSKLEKEEQYKDASGSKKVKAVTYSIPSHLIKIRKTFPLFPIELEEMYSPGIWFHCKKNDWLVKRTDEEVTRFVNPQNINQSISQVIKDCNFSRDEELYVFYKIADKHKEKVSKYIIKHSSTKINSIIPALINFFDNTVLNFLIKA